MNGTANQLRLIFSDPMDEIRKHSVAVSASREHDSLVSIDCSAMGLHRSATSSVGVGNSELLMLFEARCMKHVVVSREFV